MTDTDVAAAQAFIDKGVAASELSTSQSFLIDLCELLGVDRPHPTPEQDYMFERPLTFQHADEPTPEEIRESQRRADEAIRVIEHRTPEM